MHRDIEILKRIAQNRFLRSSHIVALVAGGYQGILKRLQLLFHHGYVERLSSRTAITARGGGEPLVYSLAAHGADLLKSQSDIPFRRLEWISEHRSNESVAHALMISDFLANLELSCRDNSHLEFIPPEKIRGNMPDGQGLIWSVNPILNGTPVRITLNPDSVFGLRNPGNSKTAYFFLEADRGTMPVVRKNFEQSSFFRKLVGYYHSWRHQLPKKYFGFDRFRVITITTNVSRLENLVAATQRLNGGLGCGLFLFGQVGDPAGAAPLTWELRSGRPPGKSRLSDGLGGAALAEVVNASFAFERTSKKPSLNPSFETSSPRVGEGPTDRFLVSDQR